MANISGVCSKNYYLEFNNSLNLSTASSSVVSDVGMRAMSSGVQSKCGTDIDVEQYDEEFNIDQVLDEHLQTNIDPSLLSEEELYISKLLQNDIPSDSNNEQLGIDQQVSDHLKFHGSQDCFNIKTPSSLQAQAIQSVDQNLQDSSKTSLRKRKRQPDHLLSQTSNISRDNHLTHVNTETDCPQSTQNETLPEGSLHLRPRKIGSRRRHFGLPWYTDPKFREFVNTLAHSPRFSGMSFTSLKKWEMIREEIAKRYNCKKEDIASAHSIINGYYDMKKIFNV